MLANTFAEAIVANWIPIAVPMKEYVDPMAPVEQPPPMIGHYIQLPAYAN